VAQILLAEPTRVALLPQAAPQAWESDFAANSDPVNISKQLTQGLHQPAINTASKARS